jgi:hypothetical protein
MSSKPLSPQEIELKKREREKEKKEREKLQKSLQINYKLTF